ncbi:purine-nucleoside phosphorylase [Oceanivirga miroungae]|uniref:Purine nucleoside phosphorylase n=1 Tax=Oceanivirga miroungae TaxID=1130046 RepID=A0A6I8MCM3_9FUSO|nr:purine-nucleoside phosphorylase [Oceanivirga miroungae]VWL85232.1 Purine nucleoside phosphorylase 1 [Oceanivirga miroungae]
MFYNRVLESKEYIRNIIKEEKIDLAIILGSGLGKITDIFENKVVIPYKDIPGFPQITVKGHEGNLVFGNIGNKKVMAVSGRFHYYEGFTMKEVAYPVFLMKLLDIKTMIVSNACGGINPNFKPGDIMIITDFINSISNNPLIGANDERFGVRFPDMSEPFSNELIEKTELEGKKLGLDLKKGVYTFFQGPYYETKAEIRMYKLLGSDAIGMSTVPEVIASNYLGIKTVGLSCITNMATGLRDGKHSHEEVLEIAKKTSENLCKLVENLVMSM